jgi:membrane protease YdiL (CAAX protease family)
VSGLPAEVVPEAAHRNSPTRAAGPFGRVAIAVLIVALVAARGVRAARAFRGQGDSRNPVATQARGQRDTAGPEVMPSTQHVRRLRGLERRSDATAGAAAVRPAPVAVAVPMAFVVMLALVELLIAHGHLLAGQLCDAVLLLVLVNVPGGAWLSDRAEEAAAAIAAMRALALVALARVVGIAVPIVHYHSSSEAQMLVAALVGLAAARLGWLLGFDARRLLALGSSAGELAAVGGGAAIGVLVYYLGGEPSVSSEADLTVLLGAVEAATLTALVEEFLFRGLLLALFARLAGRAGVLAPTALFAFTYAGSGSLALVLAMAVAGALFAYAAHSSGRLGAAFGGHALLSLAAGVVLPVALGARAAESVPALATATAVVAFAIVAPAALAYAMRRATA